VEPTRHKQSETVRFRLRSDPKRILESVPGEDAIRRAWKHLHPLRAAKPIAAALIIGGGALVLATELGATELAVGAMAAYVTYRMMRYGLDLKQALTETVEIEREVEEIA
jgi:hypothetical protein